METSQFQAVSSALPCRSYRNPNKVSGLHLLSFLLSNSWPNLLLPHVCWHDMALSAFSSWRMKIRKISSQKHDPLHVIIQSPLYINILRIQLLHCYNWMVGEHLVHFKQKNSFQKLGTFLKQNLYAFVLIHMKEK